MNNTDVIIQLSDFIKRYKNCKNIKLCVKFGKYSQFGFEEGIFSVENYEKILKLLESCETWEDKKVMLNDKYIEKPIKIIDSLLIRYIGTPYDFIITAETVDKEQFFVSEMNKSKIDKFKRKYHWFILSKNKDERFIGQENFNFSLEIIGNEKIKDSYLSESTFLKIKDIINACEKIENDSYLEKVN